ncbi:hypothetical protein Hanom_Chr00s000007g01614991 [Helianthus anomalus]
MEVRKWAGRLGVLFTHTFRLIAGLCLTLTRICEPKTHYVRAYLGYVIWF